MLGQQLGGLGVLHVAACCTALCSRQSLTPSEGRQQALSAALCQARTSAGARETALERCQTWVLVQGKAPSSLVFGKKKSHWIATKLAATSCNSKSKSSVYLITVAVASSWTRWSQSCKYLCMGVFLGTQVVSSTYMCSHSENFAYHSERLKEDPIIACNDLTEDCYNTPWKQLLFRSL